MFAFRRAQGDSGDFFYEAIIFKGLQRSASPTDWPAAARNMQSALVFKLLNLLKKLNAN
jgi:hypothetical protein